MIMPGSLGTFCLCVHIMCLAHVKSACRLSSQITRRVACSMPPLQVGAPQCCRWRWAAPGFLRWAVAGRRQQLRHGFTRACSTAPGPLRCITCRLSMMCLAVRFARVPLRAVVAPEAHTGSHTSVHTRCCLFVPSSLLQFTLYNEILAKEWDKINAMGGQ